MDSWMNKRRLPRRVGMRKELREGFGALTDREGTVSTVLVT